MSHHGREGNDLEDLREDLQLARDGWSRDLRRLSTQLQAARERERELIGLLRECAGYLENNVAFKNPYGESLTERSREVIAAFDAREGA